MGEERLIEMANDAKNIENELAKEIQARICFCEEKHFMFDWEEEIIDSLHAALKSAQTLNKKLIKAANHITG